jgi:hypothetical protein
MNNDIRQLDTDLETLKHLYRHDLLRPASFDALFARMKAHIRNLEEADDAGLLSAEQKRLLKTGASLAPFEGVR